MTINSTSIWFLLALPALLGGCGENTENSTQLTSPQLPETAITGNVEEARWYSQAQLDRGVEVFAGNCAVCHGDRAQGLAEDWRQRDADGFFPPPPLNGSAHAWHHPLPQLLQTIDSGGQLYGGQMPPFEDVLSNDDKLAAIAFFQSFWNEEIYSNWLDMGGLE